MKKRFLKSIVQCEVFFLLGCSLAAWANSELDYQFSLETIGCLKAWDNVDGLFADYVSNAYQDYFSHQNRFVYQDLSKADAVLEKSKLPYRKLIEDLKILEQISRSMRVQSLIRTVIFQEGKQYRFVLDWLHAPKMELLAQESFELEESSEKNMLSAEEIHSSLMKGLDRLIHKIPFQASITGRDDQSVTVSQAWPSTVQEGDTLVVGTLEEVKKHPLLNSIIDWRFAQIGRLKVETIDGGIAFCKILEEEPGKKISRYQKIIQAIPRSENEEDQGAQEAPQEQVFKPTLGWVSAGLWLGQLSRQYSSTTGGSSTTVLGSGILYGAKLEGQAWLDHRFFSELLLGIGTSVFLTQLNAGYYHYLSSDLAGPKGWVKLGYQSIAYSNSTDLIGSTSFKGLILSLGGEFPWMSDYGVIFNFDYGLINSATASAISDTVNGSRSVSIFLGGYYHWKPRLTARVGVEILSNNADFTGGGSLTQKVISIVPSLLYFF